MDNVFIIFFETDLFIKNILDKKKKHLKLKKERKKKKEKETFAKL